MKPDCASTSRRLQEGVTCGGGALQTIAMAPHALLRTRTERHSRSGTRRVTNKSLNLKRTPTAYALFAHSLGKRTGKTHTRRLRGKQFVFRMDLVARRWKHLPDSDKQVYVSQAQEALRCTHEARKRLLERRHGATVEGAEAGASTGVAAGAVQPTPSSAVAEAGTEPQMWLALPMSPGVEASAMCGEEVVDMDTPCTSPRTSLPRLWQWCERPSLAQRDLRGDGSGLGCGANGLCTALRDEATQEACCLLHPRLWAAPMVTAPNAHARCSCNSFTLM